MACAALGSTPELAPQLHGLVSKLSSSQNPQIQVSILDMYVKYGYIHQAVIQLYTMEKPTLFCWNSMIFGLSKSSSTLNNALELFHMMPERNTVSWNIIISSLNQHGFREDAISMFSEMNRQGYKSDPVTYAAALESSVAVHAQIIKLHSTADTSLGHALLNSYAKTRDLEAAGKAFDELTRPSIESWTAVISLFAQSGYHEKAITLFNQMRMVPLAPDRTSFSQFLGACSSKDHLVLGIQLHGLVSKTGYATCTIVANALMGMYSKTGIFHYVRIIFQSMTLRNVLSWNVILESFVKNGRREEVMKMYVCMLREEEARPDSVTFAILFSVCADLAVLNLGKQLLSHSARLGLDSDVAVANSAVKFYAKCGKIEEARKIFDSIGVKDLVSWNTIISGYAQNGFARKALQSFECMLQTGINPDSVTFLGLLSACRHAGLVTEGKYYFSCMGSYRNIEPAQEHFACMVDLLGRSGLVEEAKKMIDEMEIQPSVEIWGALLSSCRTHSRVELAEIAMENLLKLDSTHAGGFSLLSHVYAESGMVNATAGMRKLMKERGIKKSPGCSWLEFDGKIHVFAADESNHPKIADVMVALNMITISLRAWGYEDKGTARGHHSEKLAIAFGLMNLPSWNSIHVMKNLRVCGDCHGFCKAVSLVYGRELVIRDASRFHHFSGGFCSCQDFW
ncbi:pentatricopeptide repeat-containing protein At2g01510, mitochondrial-like [Wolffia australiana]